MIMMKVIVMVQMICWMNWENKEKKYSERIVEYLYTHEQYTYEYTNLLTNDNLGICLGQVLFLMFKKIVNVFKKSVAFSKKNWYIKRVQMVCKYEPVPEVVGVPKRRKL